MKTRLPYLLAAVAISSFTVSSVRADKPSSEAAVRAGESSTLATSAHGTITSRTPDAIVMSGESGTAPTTYVFTKTTQYVDQNGNPVSAEVVNSGIPVTVQYTREGNRFVASRVTVYGTRNTPENEPSVALHKTTVTTERPDGTLKTRTSEHGDITTHSLSSHGTINARTPDSFVVKSQTETAPVTYTFTKETQYVDENGKPVSVEVVKSGVPVTVEYVRDGDHLRASRVIVHQAVPAPAAQQK